jgi:hypothetical protein
MLMQSSEFIQVNKIGERRGEATSNIEAAHDVGCDTPTATNQADTNVRSETAIRTKQIGRHKAAALCERAIERTSKSTQKLVASAACAVDRAIQLQGAFGLIACGLEIQIDPVGCRKSQGGKEESVIELHDGLK